MYRLKESGVGKKWCGDEIIILTHELSQRKLKKLFTKNCEFIEYEQATTIEETETSSSTEKKQNTGVGSNNGHKSNTRKRGKKPKTN